MVKKHEPKHYYCILVDDENLGEHFCKILNLSISSERIKTSSKGTVYTLSGTRIVHFKKGSRVLNTQSWQSGVYLVKAGGEVKRVVKVR